MKEIKELRKIKNGKLVLLEELVVLVFVLVLWLDFSVEVILSLLNNSLLPPPPPQLTNKNIDKQETKIVSLIFVEYFFIYFNYLNYSFSWTSSLWKELNK